MNSDNLKKALLDFKPEAKEREFLVMQGCLTNGIVQRSALDLNLCDNEKCVSCQQFHEALEKEAKKYGE